MDKVMALLAAPVSAQGDRGSPPDRDQVWLRAPLDVHTLHPVDGSDTALGRGLEDLLHAAEHRGMAWVVQLSGGGDSLAFALSVLGAGTPLFTTPSTSQAMAALVDACAGASHHVLVVQCEATNADKVRASLARGDLAVALREARLAIRRDASRASATVGLRPADAALLWCVAVPGPAPLAARPTPARGLASRLRALLPPALRIPSRLTKVLAALLIASIAVGSAAWVITHRSATGTAELGGVPLHDDFAPAGVPPARASAMAATWDRTAEVILFGGAQAGSGHGIPFSDTWRGGLQPAAAWTRVTAAPEPSSRLAGAIAADPTDGYVVLYGGEGPADTALGDTWTYAGSWTQRQPQHSPPVGPALAATEPSTGRVIVTTACCALGAVPTASRMQTWRWSGADWDLLGAAPGWVSTASLVADGWDGTVVMLAAAGNGSGATFTWDGATWTAHDDVAEPPVSSGSRPQLAYDPRSRSVIDVVSTQEGHATWAWNGTTWHLAEPAGGPPVIGMVLAEPVDGHAVLYGGTGEADEFTQRWYWTGSGWAESIRPPAVAAQPSAAFAAAVAADPGTGGLVLFGGNQALDETWVWSGSDWTQAFFTTPAPAPRQGASLVYDPTSRQALMVGGQLATGAPAADMWAWQGNTWVPVHPPGRLPPPSSQAPIAWDRARGDAVLLTPPATPGPLATVDTWVWDGVTWSQHATTVAPPYRDGSSMSFDPTTGGLLLLVPCCQGSTTQSSETWLWDGVAWQRLQTLHSPPLHASVSADQASHRVLLVAACCAGFDGDTIGPPQTWVWDGTDWTRLSAATLPALQDVAALSTDASGAVTLVGRLAGAGPQHPLDGLWRWSGTAWDRLF